ncbi:MAG: UvrD-helicase domain-containing protein [Deltaproteobacteria bacterium]|nr:UvrD-helicase domain-containing protein [Deltaproteobacteria bacterium]
MKGIVDEEENVLRRVQRNLASRSFGRTGRVDYDDELIALRDEIGEARLEDVPALVAQMERLQAVAARRAEVINGQVDVASPYFGRIVLQERDRKREVLIGRATYLDSRVGVHIVDWREAPVSRLYYCYDEGDDYEEVFGSVPIEGEMLVRRNLTITEGVLRRISTPQGTFVRKRDNNWSRVNDNAVELRGGQGAALRPEQHHRPGKLGLQLDGDGREDKHLQEIAALIDPRQFQLITSPETGLVVIQGGAGSGKTTVGLHRMAYLAYQLPKRFRPDAMLVVTFNDALARYVSRVLPALGVNGVQVTTYQKWGQKRRIQQVPGLPTRCTTETPETVVRLKKHPAILSIIDDWIAQVEASFFQNLKQALQPFEGADTAFEVWNATRAQPLLRRMESLYRWSTSGERGGPLFALKHAVEREVARAGRSVTDVATIWSELLTDQNRLNEGFKRYAPNSFTESDIESVFRWCTVHCSAALSEEEERHDASRKGKTIERNDREIGVDGQSESEPVQLDWEDNALLLRIAQRIRGALRRGKEALRYEHVFIDEAQDLSPVELAVVLDTVNSNSVTLAGDVAQRLLLDNGFSDWDSVLQQLGLSHVELEPLKLSYRSTFEIIEFANHVLGHLVNKEGDVATRRGAEVELFRFVHMGDAVGFLANALRSLAQSEPLASVALIARYPEHADLYFRGLANAEVPNLRRIADQDFPFKAGIDVTEVRQVKGLEFDYVVLIEVSSEVYGLDDESRYLLHIAATRAAHQLWITTSGEPSSLLPRMLRDKEY